MDPWTWAEVVANRELCVENGAQRSILDFHIIYTLYGPMARTLLVTLLLPIVSDMKALRIYQERRQRYNAMIERMIYWM